jgi:MFS transporter, SET family, sugar efflux transporter
LASSTLVEFVIMPFSVMLGRKIGFMQLMAAGAFLGLAADLSFALTGSAAGRFAGQILMGGVWGIFAALGIILAQRLLPTASAIFMSSTAISSALGGLAGGLGVAAPRSTPCLLHPGRVRPPRRARPSRDGKDHQAPSRGPI